MKKIPWAGIFGVAADVISLVTFALFLSRGPATGLLQPGLEDWWMALLLLVRLSFFMLLSVLVWRQPYRISPLLQRVNNWLICSDHWWKKLVHFFVWVGLIGLATFQLILDLIFIFINFAFTSNEPAALAQISSLSLLILSVLAFSALCAFRFRENAESNTKITTRALQRFPGICLVMISLSGVLFPFFTLLLVLRLLHHVTLPQPTQTPTHSLRLYGITQTLLAVLMLNLLHLEVAVEASSQHHPFIYYIQRAGLIFFFWYVPYKGILWFANENRTTLELAWAAVFFLLQIILIYLAV
ncbi:MAG: hypothetical protein AAB558_02105 [Patescibacteria group bacterium]